VYAEGSGPDDAMACTDVTCHHQRRRTPMKNCLIKPKRKSVILYHTGAHLQCYEYTEQIDSFASDNFTTVIHVELHIFSFPINILFTFCSRGLALII